MLNGLSVDIEDWFQVGAFERVIDRANWDGCESRVERNTDAVLAMFAQAGVIDLELGADEPGDPRVDAVESRPGPQAPGEVDQGKARAAADVEHDRPGPQGHVLEKEEAVRRRPQRRGVVRGDEGGIGHVDDVAQERQVEGGLLRRHRHCAG